MSDLSIGLFPTPILKCEDFLNTSEINDIFEILKSKTIFENNIIVGGKSSHNANGHENIIQTLGLEDKIQEKLNVYTDKIKIHAVSILSSWFNIQDIGSVLKLHMHTQSLLSAAIYINVDEKSSPLFFYNPNLPISNQKKIKNATPDFGRAGGPRCHYREGVQSLS